MAAALGAVAAIGALVVSSAAGAGVVAGAPPACERPPMASGGTGTWFRLDPVLERGELVGQLAIIGRPDGTGWTVRLAAEAFVAPPTGGLVLVGTDDGRRSVLQVIDAVAGCTWDATAPPDIIVRRAILAPDGRGWFEHRLDREDRADLGLWRRDIADGDARRVLAPIEPDERFGITWSTPLAWDVDGRRLVVQSCGQDACRTRVVDPATGDVASLADPHLGVAIGLAGDALVVRGPCRGLPCPIVVADLRDGSRRRLVDGAGLATVLVDGRRRAVVVAETDAGGRRLRRIDLRTGRRSDLGPLPRAHRLVGPTADTGVELPIGTWLTSPDGRIPSRGPAAAIRSRLEGARP